MNKKITTSFVACFLLTTNLYSNNRHDSITVYSATKSEQSIKDVTSNVEIITKEEIEEKRFTSLTEALNTLPGISFTRSGGIGASTSLFLRGTSNNRVLVLIDGIKYKDHSSISGTNIANLMITDIERIEVIKGAQSGIWGADAAAGIINIITKKTEKGTHGSILVEAGSFDTLKYSGEVSHKAKNFDIKVNAQRITSDSFSSNAPRGGDVNKFEDDKYKNTTFGLKTNYYLTDSAKIKMYLSRIDSLKDYDSFSNPNDSTLKNDSLTKIYSFGIEENYDNHKVELNFEKTNTKRVQVGTTYGVKNSTNTTTNIELKDTISYGENDFLIAGIGFNKDKINYITVNKTTNNASNKTKYIYVTNSNKFDKLTLTESLRFEKFSNFDRELTGKIGLKYDINEKLAIFSNYGTAYSTPLLIKNINPWGDSNFDIEPEESKSFDVGLNYSNFKVTYFRQKVKNLISWYDPDGYKGPQKAIYKNLDGKSTFKGYELSYQKNIFTDFLLSLNYTHLKTKDSKGKSLNRRVKDQLGFGLDYYGIQNLHLNINGQYIGDRKDSKVNTGNYTVWNSVINYKINKNLSTYLKVDNLFNKYYQTINNYATAERSAYIGLKASF